MASLSELFLLARQRHEAGDLASAEHLYRYILGQNNEHADAWHLLGVLATQQGHAERALEFIGRALKLCPAVAGYHLNLGVAYRVLGRRPEALASFQESVRLQPDLAEAQNNLANILLEQGNRTAAIQHWEEALRLRPNYSEAHNNLGQALLEQNQLDQAIAHCEEALRLQPHFAQAHYNLGNARTTEKNFAGAAACYENALRLQPDFADAYRRLGHVLRKQERLAEALIRLRQALHMQSQNAEVIDEIGIVLAAQGKTEEAAQHFQKVLSLQPNHAEAHNNLGVVRLSQRRFDEAVQSFQQAIRLQPDLADAHHNLGNTLFRQGRLDEAVASYREALRLRPHEAPGHSSLACTLADQGFLDEAITSFREAMRLDPTFSGANSSLLMALNYDPNVNSATLLEEHRLWASSYGRVPILGPAPDHDRDPERQLRVGYVSADFCQHILARFVEPILAHHDPHQVEAICYADVANADLVTARLQSLAHRWHSICGLSDLDVAQRVQRDRVDILIDLGGHTSNRLGVFARKPAPIQVTYLGYPHTTGLSTIDYRLTDAVADPIGEDGCHTEELVRLPAGFCCYTPDQGAPLVSLLPALRTGAVTFGSVHKLAKLNARVLDLWCRLLHALPSARLLAFRDSLRDDTRQVFLKQFARRGLAENRLTLTHKTRDDKFLSVYEDIDIALDVFPWTGHGTACEALWQGVPVLTLRGNRHAGRMVASVLTQVGLTDWIADNPEDFVAKALRFANDRDLLTELRTGLRGRMQRSPLCDGKAFTRHLEDAYRTMWRTWLSDPEKPTLHA
jgi:predicted O-linked N-acetylglucosamine transferase (SPINDLY family)